MYNKLKHWQRHAAVSEQAVIIQCTPEFGDSIHETMNTPADPYNAVEPVLDGCYIPLPFLKDVVCPGTLLFCSVDMTNLVTVQLDGSSQSPKTVMLCSILSKHQTRKMELPSSTILTSTIYQR